MIVPHDASFDPALAGTAESIWEKYLESSPAWSPTGAGPVLIVSPHPDDEVLGAGGLIHSWRASGREVKVLSVTDGEAAYADCDQLGSIRRQELKSALRKLSATHIEVVRLGLPDGKVSDHKNRLRGWLASHIGRDTTLVAPYERDGHPDHDSVGTVCCELSVAEGVPLARYPIWSWHHFNPQDFSEPRWGKFPLDPEAKRAKAHALQCYTSQFNPEGREPVVPAHVLHYFQRSYEAFLI